VSYLDGTNVAPANAESAKKLLGHYVRYLRSLDIDKSGRGYVFPKSGVVTGQFKRNLEINGDLVPFSSFVEINILREATQEEMSVYC